MNSRVLIADGETHDERTLTLCYPPDTDPDKGFVSVLSPIGTGLLGLVEGQLAQWVTPGGSKGTAKIIKVIFQPEDSGEYLR